MKKIIAFANQKGGVGKTTTVINLGAYLAELGQKTLIVDLDPQGNAGSGLGLDVMNLKSTLYQYLLDESSYEDTIQTTNLENLFVLPSNIDLSGLDVDLRDKTDKETRLKSKLLVLADKFDFVLIDCPPSLGLLTINALTVSNSVLIPLQCEYFALEGLTQLLRIINLVQKSLNKNLKLEGVLLTMYDPRTKLSSSVVEDVRKHFGTQAFDIVIPRNVKLSEAPSFGKSINQYDSKSAGAIAYQNLARILLSNNK